MERMCNVSSLDYNGALTNRTVFQQQARTTPVPAGRDRIAVFVDYQNGAHRAKSEFGHVLARNPFPEIAYAVVRERFGHSAVIVRQDFYTGVPRHEPVLRELWRREQTRLTKAGIHFHSGDVRPAKAGQPAAEKGTDVQLAIDAAILGLVDAYDIALIFSQDQDFVPLAKFIRSLCGANGRAKRVASAFPHGAANSRSRGIEQTEWIAIDRRLYDAVAAF